MHDKRGCVSISVCYVCTCDTHQYTNVVCMAHTVPQVLLGLKDKRPVAKVADFGLSKSRHTTFLTNMSSQRGTLPWIAPEILRTPDTVTEKADVFSFGVMMWELWTSKVCI